jgi:arsenate reductase
MAEVFLRRYGGARFEAYSASLDPPIIYPYTVCATEEIGIDVTGQYSKPLGDYLGKVQFDYVITVCAGAEMRFAGTLPGVGKRLHWSLSDPAATTGTEEQRMREFQVRDQIERYVCQWLSEREAL